MSQPPRLVFAVRDATTNRVFWTSRRLSAAATQSYTVYVKGYQRHVRDPELRAQDRRIADYALTADEPNIVVCSHPGLYRGERHSFCVIWLCEGTMTVAIPGARHNDLVPALNKAPKAVYLNGKVVNHNQGLEPGSANVIENRYFPERELLVRVLEEHEEMDSDTISAWFQPPVKEHRQFSSPAMPSPDFTRSTGLTRASVWGLCWVAMLLCLMSQSDALIRATSLVLVLGIAAVNRQTCVS